MADLALQFGGDLVVSAAGDLLTVSGDAATQQRVLRRLLTNPGDYIWNLLYGAGLGLLVGTPAQAAAIKGKIFSQIFQEASVARVPAPTVAAQVNPDGTVTATINYYDAVTLTGATLTFQA